MQARKFQVEEHNTSSAIMARHDFCKITFSILAMTKTSVASSKRSISDGYAEPSAKRSRKVDAGPSWVDLQPELIGNVARYLPMGTPDMMRLLLCVGPRAAAVVRKMYLTGSDYYLWYYERAYESGALENNRAKENRAKECIGFWIRYNERSWKKRCLGKIHEDNVHSVLLTAEQIRSLRFWDEDGTSLIYCSEESIFENSAPDEASFDVLKKIAKNSGELLVVSVGDNDVDNGLMTSEELQSMIDAALTDKNGKVCLRFMRGIDALFAYPEKVIKYDLVDVLMSIIDETFIKHAWITSLDEDGNHEKYSLLHMTLIYQSMNCFRYLLALPGTDINASSWLCTLNEDGEEDHENIIHGCFYSDDISPIYLKEIIDYAGVELDARSSEGETALCKGCRVDLDIGDQTIAKIRLLLEAGADPRIPDIDENTPVENLTVTIEEAAANSNTELESKLTELQREVKLKISQWEEEEAADGTD